MEYSNYLKTSHWKATRERVLKQKGIVCKICESDRNIHVHHKVYKDRLGKSILFREKNYHLIPLCGSCHTLWHRTFGYREIRPMDYVRAKLLIELGSTRKQAIWLSVNRRLGIEWLKSKLDQQMVFPR